MNGTRLDSSGLRLPPIVNELSRFDSSVQSEGFADGIWYMVKILDPAVPSLVNFTLNTHPEARVVALL